MFGSGLTLEQLILKCKNIAFVDLGSGDFSSFYASSFALYVADMGHKVCYTECGIPGTKGRILYDSMAIDRRFKNSEFVDFYEKAREDRKLYDRGNFDEGINWRLITPEDVNMAVELTDSQMGRLIFSARGDLCVYDFGSCDKYDVFLEDMDALIFLVDPLPSRIIRGSDRILKMKQLVGDTSEYIWVVYNMNKGVSKRQVKSIVRDKNIVWIESIGDSLIYGAEYRGQHIWESAEIREKLTNSFC